MISRFLMEDIRIPKMKVILSKRIKKQIADIENYNQGSVEALNEWRKYIDLVLWYLSNRSIAFDYANRAIHFQNGTLYLKDLNINAGFTIIDGENDSPAFVYIFKLNFKLDDYGLKIPPVNNPETSVKPVTKESQDCIKFPKIVITESAIVDMVRESVERILDTSREKVGGYEIIDGDCFAKNYAPSLKEFGAFLEIRMYCSKNHTYCFHCRYDNGMPFWAEIVPAPELGKNSTKYRPISVTKVPSIILDDAQSLLRKAKKAHKTVS